MLFGHDGIELEINNRNIPGEKKQNIYLNILINEPRVKEVTRELRKYFLTELK